MTRVGDIVNQALRLANRVDPAHRQRALEAVNRNVEYFSERAPWPSLERVETFLADGTEFLTLPPRVRAIIAVGDLSNQIQVNPGTHFERLHPAYEYGSKPSSTPCEWRDLGYVPVIRGPGSATALEIWTSASAAHPVYVKGLTTDSGASGTALEKFEYEEIVVAGYSPVQTSTQFVDILAIEADEQDKDVDIVVRYAATGLPAARIPKNKRSPQYRRLQFLLTPAAGTQLKIRYYTAAPEIASEAQVLEPQVNAQVVLWRTVGDLHWIAQQAEAAQVAWNKAEELIETHLNGLKAHGAHFGQMIPYAPFVDTDNYNDHYYY